MSNMVPPPPTQYAPPGPYEPKKTNGFSVVALVLSILAVVLSVVPIINLASYVLAVPAIIFAIVALVRSKLIGGQTMAIISLGVAVVAIAVASLVNLLLFSVVSEELEKHPNALADLSVRTEIARTGVQVVKMVDSGKPLPTTETLETALTEANYTHSAVVGRLSVVASGDGEFCLMGTANSGAVSHWNSTTLSATATDGPCDPSE